MAVHLLLLAGGKGSRFWPMSRPERPKQLLPLLSEKSLLRETWERARPLASPGRCWVLGSASLGRALRAELPELPPERFIGEPVGRNTAAGLALGAALALREDPQAVLAVPPCDHAVGDPAGFRRAARMALKAAREEDALITLGVRPTRAETGYGSIRPGHAPRVGELQRAEAFVEKPSAARARRFQADGRHLWNSGMFFFGGLALRGAFLAHAPDIWMPAESLAADYPGRRFARRMASEFPDIPALPFDVAVMEKARDIRVLPVELGWDDLGSWEALAALLPERNGNRVRGRVFALDARGNIVLDPDGTTALVGVENLVVVRDVDRILVCRRDRAQSVRDLVALLDTE